MTWSDVQGQRAETVSLRKPLSSVNRPRGALFRSWGQFGYWGSSSGTLWYFVQPERRLAGYDAVSRRFIGSIGPNGFATNLAGAGDSFTILGSRSLGTSTKLVSVNLSKRTVSPIFSTLTSDPITHVGDIVMSGQNWSGTLVATTEKMHLLSPEGKAAWAIDFAMRYPDSEDFKACLLEPAGAFVLWNDPPLQAAQEPRPSAAGAGYLGERRPDLGKRRSADSLATPDVARGAGTSGGRPRPALPRRPAAVFPRI